MAWTAPMTAVSNTVFTAAQWNTYVRDNMLQSLTAKAVTAGNWFVSSAVNTMSERTVTSVTTATAETTVSTSYAGLTTATTTGSITTGTAALVFYSAKMATTTADAVCTVSVAVSGATTIAASDSWSFSQAGIGVSKSGRHGMAHLFITGNGISNNGLTAGGNTFTMQFKVSAGTATFQRRDLSVISF